MSASGSPNQGGSPGADGCDPRSPGAGSQPSSPESPSTLPGPLAGLRPGPSVVAAQRAQMGIMARAGQENAVLLNVKKQLHQLEDKVTRQLTSGQQTESRMREAGVARFESKLAVIEANQPRLDRRCAELAGNLKGVSDEVQSQIRRLDQTDERLWSWRSQLEDEVRTKLVTLETNFDQVASSVRVTKTTNDDMYRAYNQRLLKLETYLEEHMSKSADNEQSLLTLHSRLTEVEDVECERQRSSAVALQGGEVAARTEVVQRDGGLYGGPQEKFALAALEAQVADAVRQLQELHGESHELLTRVESQEERLRTVRSKQDTSEEQHRSLLDRVDREIKDLKVKELHTKVQEMDKQWVTQAERLEVMDQRVHGQRQAHEELGNVVRRLQERSSDALALMAGGDLDPSSPVGFGLSPYAQGAAAGGNGGLLPGLEAGGGEVAERMQASEERLEQVSRELQILKSDQAVGSHVSALVGALQDVAPKVVDHGVQLQDILPKVNGVELGMQELQGRVERLAAEVGRLSEDLAQGELPEAIAEDAEAAPNFHNQRKASSTE